MTDNSSRKLHALWMFDIDNIEEAEMYFKFAIEGMPALGGTPILMGRFNSVHVGDIEPRQFYVVAEWESREHFDAFAKNAGITDKHSLREGNTSANVRHFFDGVNLSSPDFSYDDLRELLKP